MICVVCNETKTEDSFSFRNKSTGKRHNKCKECHKSYRDEHYAQNRKSYIDRAAIGSTKRKHRIRELLYSYLLSHPCVDCGESDPVVLEFDHIDATTKIFSVGNAVSAGYGWSRINEEIDKCEVRCANCHRRKTAQQFGWHVLSHQKND